jgi:Protein of unknown function (DUF3987)
MSVEDFSEALKRKAEEAAAKWDDPTPLVPDHQKAEPYPIDALSPTIRGAVETYQSFGQQPIELVACSALATASLACQGLADVDRNGLTGPISLSFVSVARSGERKSSADKRMRKAAADWEIDRRRQQAQSIKAANRDLAIWKAKRDGMLGKIKSLASRSGADVERQQLESKLRLHEEDEPKVPPEVQLFYEDTSAEKLVINLATGWPSASLWSDEGGLVIGSYAMSETSALGFLTLLNRLWDGNSFNRERVSRESVHLRGRRFTVSLMLQPRTLETLVATGDGIARSVGAFSRFLMAWPNSTMGTRLYRQEKPASEQDVFNARVRALLDKPLPLDQDLCLDPPKLRMAGKAFEAWRSLHDTVENTLGIAGEFCDLTDFGAKAAEHAARLAAVIHLFENGNPASEISLDTVVKGATLALWHLNEARRIFSILGQVGALDDAQVLLDWLRARTEPPRVGDILRLGPYCLRDKSRRDRAIEALELHGIAHREKPDGGAETLILNPKIQKT